MNADSTVLRLRDTLADGVTVEHTITTSEDEVDFRLAAHKLAVKTRFVKREKEL
mgnify:CR=1 FL=1